MQPASRKFLLETIGSPKFLYRNSSQIAASSKWAVELEGTAAHKYLPLDSIKVTNSSDYDIQVDCGNYSFYVAKSVSRLIEGDIAFTNFVITNLDTSNAIPANKILVEVWRAPLSEDKYLRRKLGLRLQLGLG